MQELSTLLSKFPSELPTLSEVDVREEFVAPILNALGYSSFGPNLIIRERTIRYSFTYLGRKGKRGEIPLAGRPDYELQAGPNHRVVIECKSSDTVLSDDDIDQAYSYASHPEVKAVVYVLTNGHKTEVYHTFNSNPYEPVISLSFERIKFLPQSLSFLTPTEIIRAFPLPQTKIDVPLISGGDQSEYSALGWLQYDDAGMDLLGNQLPLHDLIGLKSDIADGSLKRNSDGRIEVKFETISRNSKFREFQKSLEWGSVKGVAHSPYLAEDSKNPTLIAGDYNAIIEAGESMVNPMDGSSFVNPINQMILQRFQANLTIQRKTASFNFEGSMQLYVPQQRMIMAWYSGRGFIELN